MNVGPRERRRSGETREVDSLQLEHSLSRRVESLAESL